MLMEPTLMLAAVAGPDHDQNDHKGVRIQVFFEFSLYLSRNWSPDAHGAHPDVGDSVGGSEP